MIGIAILVAIVVWLLANVVLPLVLLNSALILTIVAVTVKQRKALFASLAFVGAGYMLFDISNGWLSANFVRNVVKNPDWLTGFVYINAAAVALSTWQLARPLLATAATVTATNKRNGLLLSGVVVALICAAGALLPVIYYTVPNPFVDAPATASSFPAQAHVTTDSTLTDAAPQANAKPAASDVAPALPGVQKVEVMIEHPVVDDELAVQAEAVKLIRSVEMYQWTETRDIERRNKPGGGEETVTTYTYKKEWSNGRVDSSQFRRSEGHENPAAASFETKTFVADPVRVAAHRLSEEQIGQMNEAFDFPVKPAVATKLSPDLQGRLKIAGGKFYMGEDPATPMVGDVRISYRVVKPATVVRQ